METIGPRAMGEAGGSIKQGPGPCDEFDRGKSVGVFWKLFKDLIC
jgi:hypothetical protein